jgi:hypothetical protein
MSDSTSALDLISVSQAQKEVTANGLFDAGSPATAFGYRISTSSGLTWGYYGGVVSLDGVLYSVAAGTLTLDDDADVYVELDMTGSEPNVIATAASDWTGEGYVPLYIVTTADGYATAWEDWRNSAVGCVNYSSSNPTVSVSYSATLVLDLAGRPDAQIIRVTLTGDITIQLANGTDGQRFMLELTQDGPGSRLVTLDTSYFRFGTTIAGFTATTTTAKMDRIGCIYNSGAGKADVVAVAQGF